MNVPRPLSIHESEVKREKQRVKAQFNIGSMWIGLSQKMQGRLQAAELCGKVVTVRLNVKNKNFLEFYIDKTSSR